MSALSCVIHKKRERLLKRTVKLQKRVATKRALKIWFEICVIINQLRWFCFNMGNEQSAGNRSKSQDLQSPTSPSVRASRTIQAFDDAQGNQNAMGYVKNQNHLECAISGSISYVHFQSTTERLLQPGPVSGERLLRGRVRHALRQLHGR